MELTAENIDNVLQDAQDVSALLGIVQKKELNLKGWLELNKEYEPIKHSIQARPVKQVNGSNGDDKPSKIKLALQKLAVTRMSEMMFALPVTRKYIYTGTDTRFNDVKKAIEAVYKNLRIDSVNLQRSKYLFAGCEVATILYVKEEKNNKYGFNSNYRIRAKSYSPMNDDELYPLFDAYGDLIAFSVGYKRTIIEDGKTSTNQYYDCYTADNIYNIDMSKPTGEQLTIVKNPIGKIPVVYCYRDMPIYSDVSAPDKTGLIDELEWALSRNSDILAYNSAPVLKVKGGMENNPLEDKGEARRIFQLSEGGDMDYISWGQSTDALSFHVNKLLQMYFVQLQLPDISFENMKSLNVQSGEAMKMLLVDSHLKVRDESGIFLEFLDRESNIIKAVLKQANVEWASLIDEIQIESEIHPFAPNDEQAKIDRLYKANGGKALMSQKESIEAFGMTDDVEETMKQLQTEEVQTAVNASRGSLFD